MNNETAETVTLRCTAIDTRASGQPGRREVEMTLPRHVAERLGYIERAKQAA